MGIDAAKLAEEIVNLVGSVENIISVTHCMTRLRFILKDKDAAETDKLKSLAGVKGAIFSTGQYQIILGENLLPVYNAIVSEYHFKEETTISESTEKSMKPKGIGAAVIEFIAASVNPNIPALVAGGMMKVFLLIATLIAPQFAESSTYVMLSIISNAPFYFMPIFIAYGAAKKLGGTPIYAMAVAGALVVPDFVNLVEAGEKVTLFGISVLLKSYSGTLLPALLIGLVTFYVERLWNKIVPGIFRSVFVGPLTLLVSGTLSFVVLAPIGTYAGNYIVAALVFLQNTIGPVALAVLAGIMPFLVMTGMHSLFGPFMLQFLDGAGYDAFFRPALILHNMSEGGACFGVALRTKDRDLRSEAISCGVGAIFAGVTEPAIYGITITLKKPLIGVCAGGAVGGLIAGIFGAKAYVMGYSSILAIPIFQETAIAICAAIAASILVSFLTTVMIGIEPKVKKEFKNLSEEVGKPVICEKNYVYAPLAGTIIPMEKIPDPVFGEGVLGKCCGIESAESAVFAPFDGIVESIAATKHAIGLKIADGIELLIHVGLDTVKMNGQGFEVKVKEGDSVKCGELLMHVDHKAIRAAGYSDITVIAVANTDEYSSIEFLKEGKCGKAEKIMKVE